MKIRVTKHHCKGCVYLVNGTLCPFVRCIRRNGFTIDERSGVDGHQNGKR